MTVKELMDMLKKCNQNKIVHIYNGRDYVMANEVVEYEDIVEILLSSF